MELTFLIVGGDKVGKSSLLRRLASALGGGGSGQQGVAEGTAAAGRHSLKLSGQLSSCSMVDVDIVECGPGAVEKFVLDINSTVDGVILVIDCTNMNSLRSADEILLFLTEHCQHGQLMPIFLVANKADCGPSAYVVTGPNLDLYVRECGLTGWALTVAYHELGDLDVNRGVSLRNQKTIDEIFVGMVRSHVERVRKDNLKLIAHSFRINENRN